MTKVRRIVSREGLEEAAGIWIARLEADDVSDEDRQRFKVWLEEDRRHRETFEEMRHTSLRMDALGERACSDLNVRQRDSESRIRRPGIAWATAAMTLLMIGAATMWQLRSPDLLEYQTPVGHQLSVSLDDGSVIELNTDTLIEVNYTNTRRTVHLRNGEAHFTVTKDTGRPFVVLAGTGAIRAVGTRFNVFMDEANKVRVTVTDGVVEVRADQANSVPSPMGLMPVTSDLAVVKKDQRVEFDQEVGAVVEVSETEVDRLLAWRHGMLSFEGETLEEVLAQVSRYTRLDFVIADPSIRDLQVGGYFKSTDIAALVELLDTGFEVEARREGEQVILSHRNQ